MGDSGIALRLSTHGRQTTSPTHVEFYQTHSRPTFSATVDLLRNVKKGA